MITKVHYEIKAVQPIHTGSDENYGTETRLRRERVLLPEPIEYRSNFASDGQRRDCIASILHSIWKQIDWDGIGRGRLMKIYDEFSSKMMASTGVKTKEQFLTKICQKWGIRSLSDIDIIERIELFSDDEFLETIRRESQYLILLLRKKVKEKEEYIAPINLNSNVFVKSYDDIPFISGNSIRGQNRRLVMNDFCNRVGIATLDKDIYHQLFTGGNITSSTGFEDIEKRELFTDMCPMIGLFGSAIGNMTIQGTLKSGGARLRCKENGTGNMSYWELIETTFSTRLDSSKLQRDIEITDNDSDGKNQMKYEHEVFVKGSVFDSVFAESSGNELMLSAFWHMMDLMRDHGYIAGNSARDNGKIEMSYDATGSSDLYIKHINKNKNEIKEYFSKLHRAAN